MTLKKILFSLINFDANNDVEIKFLTEFSQMIKEFLIELPDYLYTLKYTNILTKALNLITIKNHFLLRVFITRYLLHSLKFCKSLHSLIFRKNLDEKKKEKQARTTFSRISVRLVVSLYYACYVPIE